MSHRKFGINILRQAREYGGGLDHPIPTQVKTYLGLVTRKPYNLTCMEGNL